MNKLKFLLALSIVPMMVACNPSAEASSSSDTAASYDTSSESTSEPVSSESSSSSGSASTSGSSESSSESTSESGSESTSESSSETESIDPSTIYWTVTFDTQGGSAVPSQSILNGNRAEEPADPTYEGYIFDGWYKDTYGVTPFDFSTVITADWTIYAGWKKDLNPSSSEESSSESSEETVNPADQAYGPDGSELVDWYLAGQGSDWPVSSWSTSGGVQLYSNPEDEAALGCILNLPFEVGDTFKVTNGSSWYGYDMVVSSDVTTTYFAGIGDGYGGQNITVIEEGTFDLYVASDASITITLHE